MAANAATPATAAATETPPVAAASAAAAESAAALTALNAFTNPSMAVTKMITLLATNAAANIAPSVTNIVLCFATNAKILNTTNPKPTTALIAPVKTATSLSPFSVRNVCTAGMTFVIRIVNNPSSAGISALPSDSLASSNAMPRRFILNSKVFALVAAAPANVFAVSCSTALRSFDLTIASVIGTPRFFSAL